MKNIGLRQMQPWLRIKADKGGKKYCIKSNEKRREEKAGDISMISIQKLFV